MREWLIKILGGYKKVEYDNVHKRLQQLEMDHIALTKAHDQIITWFQKPLIRIETREEIYCVEVAVSLEDNVPIDSLKHDMCYKMAKVFFEKELVSFDIYDSHIGNRIFRSCINVITTKVPKVL